jgi:hypothetical protein
VPDTTYRLAKHIVAKIVGLSLALVGVLMVVLTLVAAFARFRPQVLVLVGLLGLVIVIGVAAYAGRGLTLVRFDDVGYRVRTRRGSGVRSARWADVKDAVTAEVDGVPCVVIRLRDGRSTTIPVELLDGDRNEFVHDLRSRLHAR